MAENQDLKDIEVNLKRLLNMQSGANSSERTHSSLKDQKSSGADSVLQADLENDKAMPSQQLKKNKKDMSQERNDHQSTIKDGSSANKDTNNSALTNKGNDAGNVLEDEVMKKNKKKKKPKKKVKDKMDDTKDGDKSHSAKHQEAPRSAVEESMPPVYGIQQKYLDESLTPAIIKELEVQKIFPLKKRSAPFPKALYFCRICDYHCDNVPVCRQHMNDARHRRRLEIMEQDKTLKSLPTPSVEHYAALTTILEEVYQEQGLNDQEMKERETIAELLEKFLQETIPDLKLRIYGSSLTGFGLKSSDLNMDLVLPKGTNPAKGLSQVFKILKQSDVYKDVRSNFQAKVPSVLFKSTCEKVNCEITIGSDLAYFTGKYLTVYAGLDDRLRKLAVVFRHWAKICELDDQGNGTLPSYCYDLMTVYFLQEIKPQVLPVLWKDLSEEALKRPKTHQDIFDMFEELQNQPWKCNNDDSIGMLWRDLVLFYGVKFEMAEIVVCIRSQKVVLRHEKKWKSRRVAIEDPFSQKRNVARSMHSTKVFDYFYNCLRKASLYFNMPTSKTSGSNHQVKHDKSAEIHKTEKSVDQEIDVKSDSDKTDEDKIDSSQLDDQELSNGAESEGSVVTGTESDASIKPHVFMEKTTSDSAIEISDLEESVELVKLTGDGADGKETNIQVICADDSHEASKVKSESSSSGKNSSEIGAEVETVESVDCDSTCIGVDENKTCSLTSSADVEINDPSISQKTTDKDKRVPNETVIPETVESGRPEDQDDLKESSSSDSKTHVKTKKLKCDSSEETEAVITDTKSDIDESDNGSLSNTESDMEAETPDTSPLKAKRKKSISPCQLKESLYNFVFSSQTLTDGKGPSTFCQICEKEGHHKNNCPEDQLPQCKELPPLTSQHIEYLTHAVDKVPRDFSLSKEELRERESVRKNIELHLLDEFPDCELKLFGSSINGFGFHHSDLDICVTFKNRTQKDINFIQCIECIAKRLKSHRGLYQVFPITTAKVPIVKFIHRNSQLEGDISLYNVLALQNTKLLHTYAGIDKRVLILGFAIKVFAKVCDIGDASKGSLSSYAYMLLMFHYLQHTRPPIIPVLQELRKEDTDNPETTIDGWNAWFYDDLKSIPKIWPHYRQNKQSVGELWLGFFRYYMEEFNILEQVVTIRQFETLTKFEKLWNGKCIAIEDPFDLNHNLGGGLSRRMNQYILRTFIHARELYGKPITTLPNGFSTLEDYFFDREQLTEGKPPSDRLCRVCSKIGHIAKECPRVLARKEREAAEKKRKEEIRLSQDKNNSQNAQNHLDNSKNQQKRASTSRSKSDPADYSSPSKHVTTQSYHRQHSETTDHRQMGKGPDGYRPTYHQPSSPQSSNGPPFQNRYPQPQSPNTPNQYSFKQQQQRPYSHRTGHPNNLFTRTNPNEFSNQRYSHPPNHMRHSGNSPANQNIDNRNNLHKKRPANQNRDYSSSPNSNAGYMNRCPQAEGQRQPQVSFVENGLSSSGVGFTNPLPISPTVVYPPLGMQHFPFYTVLHPTDNSRMQPGNFHGNPMATTGNFQGNPMATSGNFLGSPLVYAGNIPGHSMSTVGHDPRNPMTTAGNRVSSPVVVPMQALGPVYGQAGPQMISQTDSTPVYQGNRRERVVNIHNKSGPLEDVGITVKNDLFRGSERMDKQE